MSERILLLGPARPWRLTIRATAAGDVPVLVEHQAGVIYAPSVELARAAAAALAARLFGGAWGWTTECELSEIAPGLGA
jgi:hypothetical protein